MRSIIKAEKLIEDEGTEYPICLFSIDENNEGMIMKVFNIENASVRIVNFLYETFYYRPHNLNPGVYKAEIRIESEFLFDTIATVEFHNLKKYKLEKFEEEN